MASAAGLIAGLVVASLRGSADALPFLAVGACAWPVLLWLRGAYTTRALSARDEYQRAGRATVELIALLAIVSTLLNLPAAPMAVLAGLPVMLVVALAGRYGLRRRLRALRRQGLAVRRAVAVGTGHGITTLVDRLSTSVSHDVVVVGACAEGDGPVVEDVPVLGRLPDARLGGEPMSDDDAVQAVLAAVAQVSADTVCVTGCSLFTGERIRALGWALAERRVNLVTVSGLVDVATHRLELQRAGAVSLVHVYPVRVAGPRAHLKHAADRTLAVLGLIVLLPVLAAIAAAVRLTSRGPALYRHTRLGFGGSAFLMLKFRTMVVDADQMLEELAEVNENDGLMFKVRDDPRVTRLGRFLRKYSLDELPQLVNVAAGQMSLVGPRPPLPDEVVAYSAVERRRLLVRPGMTGVWQVSGRSDLSWEETVRLDLGYVDNWSLALDAKLLARTGRAVVRGTGAY